MIVDGCGMCLMFDDYKWACNCWCECLMLVGILCVVGVWRKKNWKKIVRCLMITNGFPVEAIGEFAMVDVGAWCWWVFDVGGCLKKKKKWKKEEEEEGEFAMVDVGV